MSSIKIFILSTGVLLSINVYAFELDTMLEGGAIRCYKFNEPSYKRCINKNFEGCGYPPYEEAIADMNQAADRNCIKIGTDEFISDIRKIGLFVCKSTTVRALHKCFYPW